MRREIKVACREAMMVNNPEVMQQLKMSIINLDAANTNIGVNSLNFRIHVSDLTDKVGVVRFCFNLINLLTVRDVPANVDNP